MFKVPEDYRITEGNFKSDQRFGNNGAFPIMFESYRLFIIASDGAGWEHVSVSLKNRCPNWKEMCFIKDTFWGEEDCVIQYHPPKSEYINCHPYTLHLWRKVGENVIMPPKILVGI